MLLQKRRRIRRRREAHRQHLPAKLLEFRMMFLHLVQVRPARKSGEMAEEDEEHGFGMKIGEPRISSIKPLKPTIRDLSIQE